MEAGNQTRWRSGRSERFPTESRVGREAGPEGHGRPTRRPASATSRAGGGEERREALRQVAVSPNSGGLGGHGLTGPRPSSVRGHLHPDIIASGSSPSGAGGTAVDLPLWKWTPGPDPGGILAILDGYPGLAVDGLPLGSRTRPKLTHAGTSARSRRGHGRPVRWVVPAWAW